MVATVVSNINECHYWVTHHGAVLQKLIEDEEEAEKILDSILKDYNKADIWEKEKEMLNYAEKLTKEPSSIIKDDIEKLKEKGLIEKDILDLN